MSESNAEPSSARIFGGDLAGKARSSMASRRLLIIGFILLNVAAWTLLAYVLM